MNVQTSPTVEDLSEIVEQVWSSYLDPEGISPLLPPLPGELDDVAGAARDVCASVSITGAWHGHVVVACSATTGKHAAAALLAMDAGEVTDDDVVDALGELANIVGGNVKSTLPSQCAVSLPHVIVGSGVSSKFPLAIQVCELVAIWQGEPVSVSVWQSRGDVGERAAR
jgi:chemotaxis protein CheX